MRWVHEGEKGAMENCEVWREGEREPEKQSISGNREDGFGEGVYEIGHKAFMCTAKLCPCRSLGSFGVGPPEAGWVLLLAPLCLAPTDYFGQPSPFADGRDRPAEGK